MTIISSWDQKLSTGDTNELLAKLTRLHLDAVPEGDRTSEWRSLSDFLNSGRFNDICTFDLSPGGLTTIAYKHLAQVVAFFSKREDLDLGIDKRVVAFEAFLKSERECARVNRDFELWSEGLLQFPPRVEAALHAAQRKITEVLGPCPSWDQLHYRFGPGGTTDLPKRMACAKLKLSQQPACSEDILPVVEEILHGCPGLALNYERDGDRDYAAYDIKIVPGRMDFVPKNAKKYRAVVTEPWLNGFVQLGIGKWMGRRLKRFGIDITDQTRNQNLAWYGSVTGDLATLDLSSASDSIAWQLVMHLLPVEWFLLLSYARTGVVSYRGRSYRLEKFSSMGNGFTFPLETLIFYSLAHAVCGGDPDLSVFGDDIIVPTAKASALIELLDFCGFTTNKAKSFVDGPFRESCGADYLSGIDVRPCFIGDSLTGHALFVLHNFYARRGEYAFRDICRSFIRDDCVLTGPDGYGDGHLVSYEWIPVSSKHRASHGYCGATFDTWVYSKRSFKTAVPGDRLLPAYSVYVREDMPTPLATTLAADEDFIAWLNRQDDDYNSPSLIFSEGMRFLKNGIPVNYLPGKKGCKRISIYTFAQT